jgi:hypothetical protein
LSALSYVCLSDLHLGADYSVLTRMAPDGTIDLLEPSPTLAALGTALRQLVPLVSGGERPRLILLGDVLDLGLSPFGAVAQGFQRFLEALYPPGAEPVFSDQVICVPGNHDHHLWRIAQDESFMEDFTRRARPDRPYLPDLPDATPLFEAPAVPCRMMTQLMRGYGHLGAARADIAYPNLGLLSHDGSRCVILHHGHFTDGIYRLMSAISSRLQGGGERPRTVEQLGQENGAWIDFLWSDLGQSGQLASDAETLYETMRDAAASHQFAAKLGDWLLDELAASIGVGRSTQISHGVTVSNAVKALADATLVRAAESERDAYVTVLSADGIAGLRWYVGGPVREQMAREEGRWEPGRDTAFVFGHTHKPFQDQLTVPGFARPVAVYNTGGWVMDQPTMAPAQGAAAVFIDGDLNVASLRLFNDPQNGVAPAVRAAGVGGFRDRDNPLLAALQAAVASTEGAWAAFSAEARAAVQLHAGVILQRFFRPDAADAPGAMGGARP